MTEPAIPNPIGDLGEVDFNAWKQHPVTKLYLQFLTHYGALEEQAHLEVLRYSNRSPDLFMLGRSVGYATAIRDAAMPTFERITALYVPPKEAEEKDAA
jgi:hypothetical protein